MNKDKIYYCKITGEVLVELYNFVNIPVTTFDQDCEIYTKLHEREKNTIGLIVLEFGEYAKLKKNYNVVKVNLDTLEFEFSYIEVPTIPNWSDEVDNKISILEAENKKLNEVNKNQDTLTLDQEMRIAMLEFNSTI